MLRLFKTFIILVLNAVELTYCTFEFSPCFFIVLIRNSAGIEEFLAKRFDFFDEFLPSTMVFGWTFSDVFNFLDDFLFGHQVRLVNLILVFKIFLPLLVNGFGSSAEAVPNIFPMFPINRSSIFLPNLMKDLKFSKGLVGIWYSSQGFGLLNDF